MIDVGSYLREQLEELSPVDPALMDWEDVLALAALAAAAIGALAVSPVGGALSRALGRFRHGTGFDPATADGVVDEIRSAGGIAEASYENLETRTGCEAVVAAATARLGGLAALVHNAGLAIRGPLDAIDAETWRRSFAVNAEAAFWLCRAAFPVMRAQAYGRVVLTVSGHGLRPSGVEDLVGYGLAKGAQFGLMNALAGAAEPYGIRVNAISPVAATRMYSRPAEPGELTPEQVAPGAVFLASRACQRSGIVLAAAGGKFGVGRYAAGELSAASSPEEIAALLLP